MKTGWNIQMNTTERNNRAGPDHRAWISLLYERLFSQTRDILRCLEGSEDLEELGPLMAERCRTFRAVRANTGDELPLGIVPIIVGIRDLEEKCIQAATDRRDVLTRRMDHVRNGRKVMNAYGRQIPRQ